MKLKKANELCQFMMLEAVKDINHLDSLIKEWDNPEDIATRAAVMMKKIHQIYGSAIFQVYSNISTSCKHPKKMRDKCNGIEYCMDCNFDMN